MTTALFIVVICFLLTGCGGSHPAITIQATATPSAPVPVAVTQPPTASEVAAQVHCRHFRDKGNSPVAGVVDSGVCWIAGKKYGVDTFMTKAARNLWLQTTEKFGLSPKWETDTAVVYKTILS
jgi:hypothetical protein